MIYFKNKTGIDLEDFMIKTKEKIDNRTNQKLSKQKDNLPVKGINKELNNFHCFLICLLA